MRPSFTRLVLGVGAALLFAAILAAILFSIAGRFDLPWFWAYVALYGFLASFSASLLDIGLIKERLRPSRDARDTILVAGKVLSTTHLVIAALDVGRFHWSDPIPVAVQSVAFVLLALSGAAAVWSMVVNPFFSTVVRIQDDRGHRLITSGPYRLVRHPGYLVISILLLSSGVVLGSWWSVVPMAALMPLIIRRTVTEDRFLFEHLEGYPEYARRVRYRLIPRVW